MAKGESKIEELWIVDGSAGCRGAYEVFESDTEKCVHCGDGGAAGGVRYDVFDTGDREYGVKMPLALARAGGAGADILLSMKEGLLKDV